jgi:hypothetical protein
MIQQKLCLLEERKNLILFLGICERQNLYYSGLTVEQKKQKVLDLDLPRNKDGLYEGSNGEPIQFNGIRHLKPAYVKLNLRPEHIQEIVKCANSCHYFIDNHCQILTPNGYTFPVIRDYQWELIDSLLSSKRNVLLQPRQSAKSVTTALYIIWRLLFHNDANWGIAANQQKMSVEVLTKIKQIFSRLPIWLKQGVVTWNAMSIELENGSKVLTSATSGDSFRGYTFSSPGSGIFCDEVAFIRPSIWEDFYDSVFPTVSSSEESQIILASTPNGLNHFYNIVEDAKNKKSEFSFFTINWDAVPGRTEEWLQKQIETFGIVYCRQNYLNEFLGSSETLISGDALKKLKWKDPEHQDRFIKGFKEYEIPQEKHKYILSLDPAKGGIDFHAFQIVDVTTLPYKQVASLKTREDYLKLPETIKKIAEYYNNAYVIIENNTGSGQSIADTLFLTYEYDNLHYDKDTKGKKKKFPGHFTNEKTRNLNLNMLKIMIENGKLILADKETINEFYRFSLRGKKYQAEEGCHDDLIMSLAILCAPFSDIQNFDEHQNFINSLFSEELSSEENYDFVAFGSFDCGEEEDDYNKRMRETWGDLLVYGELYDHSGFS